MNRNGNKILIFSRFRGTLILIARLLLDLHFQDLRYLKLDGSVNEENRFSLVQQFNRDSSINLMLLTT